jgi:beta-glucosidase
MEKIIFIFLTLCFTVVVFTSCTETKIGDPYGLAGKTHSAVTPQYGISAKSWWLPRHEQVLERVAQGNVDLIFIGDSITHSWDRKGKGLAIWQQYYGNRNAVNMGFGGDRTQHVLWRLDHGEIDGISPKLAILMIGTNNSNKEDNTAEEIADGIKAICARMRKKIPKTKILILAIFPRGNAKQYKDKEHGAVFNAQWAKNNEASRLASLIADDKMIYYLNINRAFLDENGVLSRDIMPDLLHPNEKGYKIWAEAIEPTVKKLMGENP